MSLQYYRFFPGDYARDTRHLSMMQHGAYRQLIDEHMVHGPLPNDLQRLYRVCSAFSAEERAAVEYVLTEFFRLDGPAWHQSRCEKEMDWQRSKSESAQESARLSWESRRNADAKRTHKRTQSKRNANQNQNQNQNHIPEPKSEAVASSPSGVSAAEAVISIPLNDNTELAIHRPLVDEWVKLYPDCDVLQTLREIRGWNLANPSKRKTRGGVMNHINRWLAKEHNRG